MYVILYIYIYHVHTKLLETLRNSNVIGDSACGTGIWGPAGTTCHAPRRNPSLEA